MDKKKSREKVKYILKNETANTTIKCVGCSKNSA